MRLIHSVSPYREVEVQQRALFTGYLRPSAPCSVLKLVSANDPFNPETSKHWLFLSGP